MRDNPAGEARHAPTLRASADRGLPKLWGAESQPKSGSWRSRGPKIVINVHLHRGQRGPLSNRSYEENAWAAWWRRRKRPMVAACRTLPPLIYQAHGTNYFFARGINIPGLNGSPSVGLPCIRAPVVRGLERKAGRGQTQESGAQLPTNFLLTPWELHV